MDATTLSADRAAPVYSEASVAIHAPREVVWSLMADVSSWPTWNPEITKAALDGELTCGARVVWKSGPGTIRSKLADVMPPARISWTGSLLGIKAIHVWTLESNGSDTVVTTQESWDGLPVRIAKRSSQRSLDAALESGLKHLKSAAEEQAAKAAHAAAR